MTDYSPAYLIAFSIYPYQNSDGTEHRPNMNLACNNGHWTGDSRPLVPASGWFGEETGRGAEEEARFLVLQSFNRPFTSDWYTVYILKDRSVVLFDRYYDDFPGAEVLSYHPFGGWGF